MNSILLGSRGKAGRGGIITRRATYNSSTDAMLTFGMGGPSMGLTATESSSLDTTVDDSSISYRLIQQVESQRTPQPYASLAVTDTALYPSTSYSSHATAVAPENKEPVDTIDQVDEPIEPAKDLVETAKIPSIQTIEAPKSSSTEPLEKTESPSIENIDKSNNPSTEPIEPAKNQPIEKPNSPSTEPIEPAKNQPIEKPNSPSTEPIEPAKNQPIEKPNSPSTEPIDKSYNPSTEPMDKSNCPSTEPIDKSNSPFTELIDKSNSPSTEPIETTNSGPSIAADSAESPSVEPIESATNDQIVSVAKEQATGYGNSGGPPNRLVNSEAIDGGTADSMKSVVPQLLHSSKTATTSHIKQLSSFTKVVIPKPPSGGVQSVHVPAGKAVSKQSSQPPTIATSAPIEAAANTASNRTNPPLVVDSSQPTAASLQLNLESIAAVATVTNDEADSPPPKKLSVAERIKCLESNIQKKK